MTEDLANKNLKHQDLVVDFPVNFNDKKVVNFVNGGFVDVQRLQNISDKADESYEKYSIEPNHNVYINPHVVNNSNGSHLAFYDIGTISSIFVASNKGKMTMFGLRTDDFEGVEPEYVHADAMKQEYQSDTMKHFEDIPDAVGRVVNVRTAINADLIKNEQEQLVIDPMSIKPAENAFLFDLADQNAYTRLARAKAGLIPQTKDLQHIEVLRMFAYMNNYFKRGRYYGRGYRPDAYIPVVISENKNRTYNIVVKDEQRGIKQQYFNLTQKQAVDALAKEYYYGNIIIDRATAELMFTPVLATYGEEFDSTIGRELRVTNENCIFLAQAFLVDAINDAKHNSFQFEASINTPKGVEPIVDRNNPSNHKFEDLADMDNFSFDFCIAKHDGYILDSVKCVSADKVADELLKMDDKYYFIRHDGYRHQDLDYLKYNKDEVTIRLNAIHRKSMFNVIDMPEKHVKAESNDLKQNNDSTKNMLENFKQHVDEPAYKFIENIVYDLWHDYLEYTYGGNDAFLDDDGKLPLCKPRDVHNFLFYCANRHDILALNKYLPNDINETSDIISFCIKKALDRLTK